VSEARVERGAVAALGVLARGTDGMSRGPWEHLALQIAFSSSQMYVFGRAGGR